jgi:hypothetical protein
MKSSHEEKSDRMTLLRYRRIVESLHLQPAWRIEANRCAAYYDGNQIDAAIAEQLESMGMGPLVANHVKPVINTLLGMEAKNRTDWRAKTDSDEKQDVAEALSAKIAEAERETRADQAMSEAYAEQIKTGLGWIEVGRNPDATGFPYRVEPVHRNEIWWDWSARKIDLSDAQWLIRERWYPVDVVCAYFGGQAELIRAAASGWGPETIDRLTERENPGLLHAFNEEHDSAMDDVWRREEGKEVLLREVWYRVFSEEPTIRLPNGQRVFFDKANPLHAETLAEGFAEPMKSLRARLRVSLWVGPHPLQDVDAGGNDLPYVPFWGYREDLSRKPYGLIRDMIPMQDEVNARRRKLLWLLSSKRILVDSDALDQNYNDFSDLAREASRSDFMAVLDPKRTNPNGIKIESDLALSTQQYQVMQESELAIQKVAGIYNSLMGRTDGASSGRAIDSLVEQGMTSVADINDNYSHARTLVGERLLALIIEDMSRDNIEVAAGEEGRQKKSMLNVPAFDPVHGFSYRENDVNRVLLKIALADVPSTPAYRQQQMIQIAEVLKSIPPQLQAFLIPYYLESTDLPKRREMADLMRKQLGIQNEDEEIDPEKQQLVMQLQQMQQLLEQGKAAYEEKIGELQKSLEDKSAELGIQATEAEAEAKLREAQAMKVKAETREVQLDTLIKARNRGQGGQGSE